MKIAAIYDIHGNLHALQAVLEELRAWNPDQVVLGGDVMPGPQTRECMDVLEQLKIPLSAIHGNGERNTLNMVQGKQPDPLPEPVIQSIAWCGTQLSPANVQWISKWPSTVTLQHPLHGSMLFCHATPQNDVSIFTKNTPDEIILPQFADSQQQLVICGHTHMPFDRMVGPVRVINSGSVGMPFEARGASWLKIDEQIEFVKTEYDYAKAAESICQTDYPMAQEYADNNVLDVPGESKMLEAFEKAAAK